MLKKSKLLICAALVLSCGVSFGQGFTTILPSDLGLSQGDTGVNDVFDVGTILGQENNSDVQLQVINGNVFSASDAWTVSETQTTGYVLSGTAVRAFVAHGANLGSEDFQNGSNSRDGISTSPGSTWNFVSALEPNNYTTGDFTGADGTNLYVDYTGPETNQLETNTPGGVNTPFRWESVGAVPSFGVFSQNTTALNNNFSIGLATVAAIPEPTHRSSLLCLLADCLAGSTPPTQFVGCISQTTWRSPKRRVLAEHNCAQQQLQHWISSCRRNSRTVNSQTTLRK